MRISESIALMVFMAFFNEIVKVRSQKFKFHITRSQDGDAYTSEGFNLLCLRKITKTNICPCGKEQFFLLEPMIVHNGVEQYVYHCVRNFSDGDKILKLENQTKISMLEYNNNQWSFANMSTTITRPNDKPISCKKMEIVDVYRMRYFKLERIEKHPFSLIFMKDTSTTELAIDKNTKKEEYEGEFIVINLSCNANDFTLSLTFEGQRTISGDISPETSERLTTTTVVPPQQTKETSSKTDLSIIIGSAIGCVGVFLIILALVVFICVTRRQKPTVATQGQRNRSSSAPPAYDLVMPNYELPRKPSVLDYTQEGLLIDVTTSTSFPRRTPSPLPPTPDGIRSRDSEPNKNYVYEKPVDDAEDLYSKLYVKMIDCKSSDKSSVSTENDDEFTKNESHFDPSATPTKEFDDDLPTMSPLSPLNNILGISNPLYEKHSEQTLPVP